MKNETCNVQGLMGSVQESRKSQNRAIVFWRVLLLLSLLAILSPAVADRLIQFEVTMALAFFGIVCAVTSMVMIGVFKHRRKLIESISETGSFLDAWEVQDRFGEHQGKVVPACFSREGVFYARRLYPMKSYSCTIVGASIVDDEGPCLSIAYTTPNSRMGSFRARSQLNIPIPDGKAVSAANLVTFYSSQESSA